jgi:NADP-dependent 3-hydroxy acid dehydrogenase YdfG
VITGAASGIGFALSEAVVRRGMSLVMADVEQGALDAARERLESQGAKVLAVRTDVTQLDQLEALADRAYVEYGDVGLLCNNAGVSVPLTKRVWELSHGDWEWVIGVNQWGVINGLSAFVPRMLEQSRPSHVLNTCSAAGLIAGPGLAVYKASKHAALSISETLYHDLAAAQAAIGVSVFCPDVVATGLRDSGRNRPEHLQDAVPVADQAKHAAKLWAASPGLEPSKAAEIALKGVEEGRFYLFTNDWVLGAARERFEDIEAGIPRPTRLRDLPDDD